MGLMSPDTHMPTVNTPKPDRKKHSGLFKMVSIPHAAAHVLCAMSNSMHSWLPVQSDSWTSRTYICYRCTKNLERELKSLQPHIIFFLHCFHLMRKASALHTIVQQPAQVLMGQDGLHHNAQKR